MPTNQEQIQGLYQDVLGREADQGGLDFWTNALNSGTSFADIQNAIQNSTEAQQRAAQPAGALPTATPVEATAQPTGGLTTETPVEATAQPTVQSPSDVVSGLYKQYFNRDPDAEGLAFWTNALNTGSSQQDVQHMFETSPEYAAQQAVINDYKTYLGRDPDTEGLANWVSEITSGRKTADQVAQEIKSSTEGDIYNAPEIVKGFYDQLLGREADQAGLDYWTNAIKSGAATPEQVADAIRTSDEGAVRKNVNDVYQKYLGRDADLEGLNYWVDQINSGKLSWNDLVGGIAGSQESINLIKQDIPDFYKPSTKNFDAEWYLQQNPDVAANPYYASNPYQHYVDAGQAEGRAAGPSAMYEVDYDKIQQDPRGYINDMYQRLLGRDITDAEYAPLQRDEWWWTNPENSDGGPLAIETGILNSKEFKDRNFNTPLWITNRSTNEAVFVPPDIADLPDAINQISRSDNSQALIDQIKNDPKAWMKEQFTNDAWSAGWISKLAGVEYHTPEDQQALINKTRDTANWLVKNNVMTADEIQNLWNSKTAEASAAAQRGVLDQIHNDDSGFWGLGKVGEQVGDFLEKYEVPIMASILGGAVLGPAIGGAVGAVPGSATAIATNAATTGLTSTAVALASGAPTNKALLAGGLAAAGVGLGGALGPSGLNVAGSLVDAGVNPIIASVAVGALSGGALGALSGAASGDVGAGILGGALAGGTSSGVNAVSNVFGGMTGTLTRLAAGTAVGMLTGKDISSALQGAAVGTVVGLAGSATKNAINAAKNGSTDIDVSGKITPNAETIDAMRKAAADELDAMLGGSDRASVDKYVASLPESYFTRALEGVDSEVANSIKVAASYPTEAIKSLYNQDLGREPTEDDLKYWTESLRNGTPLSDIQKDIQTSPEGLQHATLLANNEFEKLFESTSDVNKLIKDAFESGNVYAGPTTSYRPTNVVIYGDEKDTNPYVIGAGGGQGGDTATGGQGTSEDKTAGLEGAGADISAKAQKDYSDAAYNSVTDIIDNADPSKTSDTVSKVYQAAFGSDIDSKLLGSLTESIESGEKTISEVASELMNSEAFATKLGAVGAEASGGGTGITGAKGATKNGDVIGPNGKVLSDSDLVTKAYEDYLGREPEGPGLEYWTGLLTSNKITQLEVVTAIKNSEEAMSGTGGGTGGTEGTGGGTGGTEGTGGGTGGTEGTGGGTGGTEGTGGGTGGTEGTGGGTGGTEGTGGGTGGTEGTGGGTGGTEGTGGGTGGTEGTGGGGSTDGTGGGGSTDGTGGGGGGTDGRATPVPKTPIPTDITQWLTPTTTQGFTLPAGRDIKADVIGGGLKIDLGGKFDNPMIYSIPTAQSYVPAGGLMYATGGSVDTSGLDAASSIGADTSDSDASGSDVVSGGSSKIDLGGKFGKALTYSTTNPATTSQSYADGGEVGPHVMEGSWPGFNLAQRGGNKFKYLHSALPQVRSTEYAEGGHVPEFYSEGGLNNRYVSGNGDGTSDDVPAMLANGEFVIPADVVSALGNGSNDSGAQVLDELLQVIRAHKQNHDPKELPPDSLGPLAYLNKATKKAGK